MHLSNNNINTKHVMKLKDSTLTEIKKTKELVRALEDLHEKASHTMKMWLLGNNPKLCHYSSLQLIAAYLKKDVDELIEYTDADFKPVV